MLTVVLWLFAGIGALTTVIALAFTALFLWEWSQDCQALTRSQSWDVIGQAYMRQRLTNDAWWFSEDEPTMNLLRRLGEGARVDQAREDWRHEREAVTKETNP